MGKLPSLVAKGRATGGVCGRIDGGFSAGVSMLLAGRWGELYGLVAARLEGDDWDDSSHGHNRYFVVLAIGFGGDGDPF